MVGSAKGAPTGPRGHLAHIFEADMDEIGRSGCSGWEAVTRLSTRNGGTVPLPEVARYAPRGGITRPS